MEVANAAPEDMAKSIATCASIKGDLARLECYDQLARARGLSEAKNLPVPTSGTGKWHVTAMQNPVDDTKTVSLILLAESGKSRMGEQVSLMLRCQSHKTEVYIAWEDYLGSEAHVLTRVGTAPAISKTWDLSTDSKATFYPGNHIALIKSLLAADRFVAQVTPYSESPVTAVFDLTGLSNAIKPLQEACGWK
jgi:type VI secretion system protein VasI